LCTKTTLWALLLMPWHATKDKLLLCYQIALQGCAEHDTECPCTFDHKAVVTHEQQLTLHCCARMLQVRAGRVAACWLAWDSPNSAQVICSQGD
jgi:hypothetical protein